MGGRTNNITYERMDQHMQEGTNIWKEDPTYGRRNQHGRRSKHIGEWNNTDGGTNIRTDQPIFNLTNDFTIWHVRYINFSNNKDR